MKIVLRNSLENKGRVRESKMKKTSLNLDLFFKGAWQIHG